MKYAIQSTKTEMFRTINKNWVAHEDNPINGDKLLSFDDGHEADRVARILTSLLSEGCRSYIIKEDHPLYKYC